MKRWLKKSRGIVVILILALSLTGCSQKSDEIVNGVDSISYLKELDQMGARVAGKENNQGGTCSNY